MSTEFTIREGHGIRELFGTGRATWVGSGAADLGLTGDVGPDDFEALSELVTDEDEDQDDVNPHATLPTEAIAVIERLRRDGLL